MSYFTAQNEQSWVHVMARGPRPVGNRFALEAKVMRLSQWRNVQACMAWSSGTRAVSPPQKPRTVVAWKSLKSASRTSRQVPVRA